MITPGGSMIFQNFYRIDSELLEESNWILHLMLTKNWFDANTFIPAYFEACKGAGIKNWNKECHNIVTMFAPANAIMAQLRLVHNA